MDGELVDGEDLALKDIDLEASFAILWRAWYLLMNIFTDFSAE